MTKQRYTISGFHCDACVKLATNRMKKIAGVQNVSIQPDGKTELLADREIGIKELNSALSGTDYEVTEA